MAQPKAKIPNKSITRKGAIKANSSPAAPEQSRRHLDPVLSADTDHLLMTDRARVREDTEVKRGHPG
ncbi:hypothetical protein NKJ64_19680, partial [Mesorhizobium sp. M0062]|uniref:hypothetical protein n=1 Tax=Mesorhizobium sp. M0062 TaxID=2956867 RepID=UPI00333B3EF8